MLFEMIDADAQIDEANEDTILDKLIASPSSEWMTINKASNIQLINELTDRQAQIVILLGEGKTHEEVRLEIGCSTRTIQRDLKAILKNKKIRKLLNI